MLTSDSFQSVVNIHAKSTYADVQVPRSEAHLKRIRMRWRLRAKATDTKYLRLFEFPDVFFSPMTTVMFMQYYD